MPRLPILSVADNKQSSHCTNVISFSVLLGATTFKTKNQGYRTILLSAIADYTYTTTKMMPKIKTEFDYDEEWAGISQVKTEPTSPGINLHRPQERQLMRPWLWDRLENQDVPGITRFLKIRCIVVT